MSEMIERVAKALEACIWECKDANVTFQARHYARAAIEAMREPTKEMIDAYDANACAGGDPNAAINLASYDDMIDAALSTPKPDKT